MGDYACLQLRNCERQTVTAARNRALHVAGLFWHLSSIAAQPEYIFCKTRATLWRCVLQNAMLFCLRAPPVRDLCNADDKDSSHSRGHEQVDSASDDFDNVLRDLTRNKMTEDKLKRSMDELKATVKCSRRAQNIMKPNPELVSLSVTAGDYPSSPGRSFCTVMESSLTGSP